MDFERVTVVLPDGQRYGPTDMATVRTWIQEGRVPLDAKLIDEATGKTLPVSAMAEAANPYASPQAASAQPAGGSDALSTIIPYKNRASLVAYYSGVFSISACLPCIGVVGLVLAVVAVVSGVKGLRYAREHVEARGRVHCWIGIIAGGVCGLVGLALQIMWSVALIAAIMDDAR